jgi:predicted Zn-dependent protease
MESVINIQFFIKMPLKIFSFLLFFFIIQSCSEATNQNENDDAEIEKVSDEKQFLNEIKDFKRDVFQKSKKWSADLKENWKSIEINGFSLEDDIEMGQQLYNEIQSSEDYKVIPKELNPTLYDYVENIKNTILESGDFRYKDKFDWKITILEDDKTINAFCAPGGFIFIYTGILKYLDNEAELAGVLAHEMGHAERRHGTRQMTKALGIQIILDFLTKGNRSDYFKQVIGNLLSLGYSRAYEREADECSVSYLCSTEYKSDGAAGFFEKIIKEKGDKSYELLSTHPDSEERILNFHELKEKLNCQGNNSFKERYKKIKNFKF